MHANTKHAWRRESLIKKVPTKKAEDKVSNPPSSIKYDYGLHKRKGYRIQKGEFKVRN
jgi:hypothetical protein